MLHVEGIRVKNSGVVLLILVIAILVVGLAAAAFLFSGSSAGAAGAGTSAATRPGVDLAIVLLRSASGVGATVTMTNAGSEDLSDLRVTQADIAALTGATPLPLVIGTLPRNAKTSVVLPYTGPAPGANSLLQLKLHLTYKYGAFGNGSVSRDFTTLVP
jgi:hypothetical protein